MLLDPNKKYPMVMPDGAVIKQVVHLSQVIDHPRIEVGDFSYYRVFPSGTVRLSVRVR